MQIEIKCPCCKAMNTYTDSTPLCRRCGTDVSLLAAIKMSSYKYRLFAVECLINQNLHDSAEYLKRAKELLVV